MIVKVQGGGKVYANIGSCSDVVSYLQHEDAERLQAGQKPEPFFNLEQDRISPKEVTDKIDNNRKGLKAKEAKFYVITVAPSREELRKMGTTKEEQAAAMKEYIRAEVMPKYAEGFNKGLKTDDLEFYGKIHFERHEKDGEDLHAHIIVSHKTKNNGKSISPMTNHTGKKNTGAAQGGFNRKEWYSSCEKAFDRRFKHERDIKESFAYRNAMKNGTPEEMRAQAEKLVQWERQKQLRNHPLTKLIEAGKEYKDRLLKDEIQNKAISGSFSDAGKEIIHQVGETAENGRKKLSGNDIRFKSAIQHGEVDELLELHRQGYSPEKNFFKELARDKESNRYTLIAANRIFGLDALPKLEDIKLARSERSDDELKRKSDHRPKIGGL